MRYLIDTGLLIQHIRGKHSAVNLIRSLSKTNRLCISSITRLEVQAGAFDTELYATKKLLSRFINYDLDNEIADKAGRLIFTSRRQNRAILVPDAIIAATAMVKNISLLTYNKKDFVNISKLSIDPLSH